MTRDIGKDNHAQLGRLFQCFSEVMNEIRGQISACLLCIMLSNGTWREGVIHLVYIISHLILLQFTKASIKLRNGIV